MEMGDTAYIYFDTCHFNIFISEEEEDDRDNKDVRKTLENDQSFKNAFHVKHIFFIFTESINQIHKH